MAYIRKRGFSWFAEVRKNGIRKQATFDSKQQAQQWAIETEAAIIADKGKLGAGKTFSDLLDRYAKEVSVTKKGRRWEEVRIGLIKRDELADVPLALGVFPEIDNPANRVCNLKKYIDAKRVMPLRSTHNME